MLIEVPDDIVRRAQVNEFDLKIALAVELYADNRIDHADACRLTGLSVDEFSRELMDRAICVHQYPSPKARPARSHA